jgi:transposase
MAKKTRKRFTAQEKVAILRLHLLEHIPISDLCDQHGIHPTMSYRRQKESFENGSAAFEPRSRRPTDSQDRRIALLEQKLRRKHEVPSELMEEHIKLRKELGGL